MDETPFAFPGAVVQQPTVLRITSRVRVWPDGRIEPIQSWSTVESEEMRVKKRKPRKEFKVEKEGEVEL